MKKEKKKIDFAKIKEKLFQQMPDKNSNLVIYIWAALIPVVIMLLATIWLKISPFGSGSYLIIDMIGQYSAFFSYLKTIIIGENNIFYSLSKAIGGDIYGLYTYYLISPINLILALFSSENIPYAVMLIIFTKIGLAGLTSNILFTRGKVNDWKSLIFSTSYALIAYNISFCYNVMWLDAVFLLPLIVVGIEKILENKSPLLYIICLSITLISNYYIGFMICIFSGIYFIYKLLLKKDKLKKYILKTLIFIIISLVAVGIAAVILFPSFKLIQEGRAKFELEILKFESNFSFIDVFSKFFTYSSGIKEVQNGGMPHVFCGVIINLLLISYFFNKKIDTREKVLSSVVLGIILISFHVNTFNMIWHGLNNPAWFYYRYSFVFSFMCIMLAHRSFENLKEGINQKDIIKALLTYFVITMLVESKKYEYVKFIWLYFDVALSIIYSYLIFNYINYEYKENLNDKKIKLLIGKNLKDILVVIIIILNSINLLINAKYSIEDIQNGTYSSAYFKGFQEVNQKIIDRIKENDTGLYRIEKTYNRTLNDAMQLNYNGISHSSSTYQASTSILLEKLGIQKKQWFLDYNNGSTEAVDSLFGIKYLLSKKPIKKEYTEMFTEDETTVYENKNALPLAFTVLNDVTNINIEDKNVFEAQNEIFKRITGKNKKIYTEEENYEIETENITESEKNGNTVYKKENEKEAASIIYNIEIADDKNLYAYIISNDDNEAEIYINDEKYGNAFYDYDTEMINLGSFEKGKEIKLEIKLKKSKFTLKDFELYYEDRNNIEEYCNLLKQEEVKLEKISSSKFEGTVDVKTNNKYILFTIPYSEGWKVKIDGKEVEKYKIMDALLSIPVEEGKHKIEMSYMPAGFKTGVIISIMSLATMIVIIIIDKKSHKKVEKSNKM